MIEPRYGEHEKAKKATGPQFCFLAVTYIVPKIVSVTVEPRGVNEYQFLLVE
jgi:hypothetical protein